jgi:hypothetical protein
VHYPLTSAATVNYQLSTIHYPLLSTFLKKHSVQIHNTGLVVLVIGGLIISFQLRFQRPSPHPIFPTQMFYTVDDGATLFVDDIGKTPPFLHNGKQAVRAYPFTCDGGQHQWVQYLETNGQVEVHSKSTTAPASFSGRLVKRPAEAEWIPAIDPRAGEIMKPKKPWGFAPGPIEPVEP